MPAVNLIVSTKLSNSTRARQVCAMFDVPPAPKCELSWSGKVPIEAKPWSVGLIVGPSGCGKSSIMRDMFGEPREFDWEADSVLDDFPESVSIQDITTACSSVGFGTIPAWLRPYRVLSNGERFRVDLARRLVEVSDPIVVDEFTSVVDRQVAQIGSHAIQKWARKNRRQFVAVSCHYDIIEWLQPDWVLEPATMQFDWRSVQPRPKLRGWIERVPYSTWALFAPYHYLTASLNKAARCFGLFLQGVPHPVAFTATLHRPHPKVRDVTGLSRTVVLPDFQGIGLSHVLKDVIGSAYKAIGRRLHSYPAHPPYVRSMSRSNSWRMVKRAGSFSPKTGKTSTKQGGFGGRPCAVFCYSGQSMDRDEAVRLLQVGGK